MFPKSHDEEVCRAAFDAMTHVLVGQQPYIGVIVGRSELSEQPLLDRPQLNVGELASGHPTENVVPAQRPTGREVARARA